MGGLRNDGQDGLYNSKTELLTLSQNIVVTSSSGYKALLNEAVIDVRAGRVVSDKPVEVKTRRGPSMPTGWRLPSPAMSCGSTVAYSLP